MRTHSRAAINPDQFFSLYISSHYLLFACAEGRGKLPIQNIMFCAKRLLQYFFVVVLCTVAAQTVAAQIENSELGRLRRQTALDYLKPAPHLALAKYYWSRGDRLQAFYITEYVRRARFSQEVFDPVFQSFFSGTATTQSNGTAATWLEQSSRSVAKETTKATTGDQESEAVFNRAAELQRAGKLRQAEQLFIKAAEAAPDSVHIQAWTGRFFYKAKADQERALHYYLNAYFLDPHAYETEFVESRIRKINWEAAVFKYRQMIKNGFAPTKILDESNPTVVLIALEQMTVRWQPDYLEAVLSLMKHDDETVRWQATEAIMKNVNRSFDPVLQTLLQDADLRRRGLAAYIAVRLWKQDSFPVLRSMLREEAQLLRYDAISALIESGEAGFKIIAEHRRNESDSALQQMIDKSLQRP